MKDKAKQAMSTTTVAFKNFERLVESLALITVSVYAINQALKMERNVLFYVLVVAGSIIVLRGAIEFFKHLARKD